MKTIVRQVLTGALLLLFSSEHIALVSTFSVDSVIASHDHSLVQQQVHTVFSLLAEENEERDGKDDLSTSQVREVFHPQHFPHLSTNKIPDSHLRVTCVRSLPIYTYHCSFLI